MYGTFFSAAMVSPPRQAAFRRVAVGHALACGLAVAVAAAAGTPTAVAGIAQVLLALGLVEGAALIGWRLTQLPKSQALEFLLASPVPPRRLFAAEMLVGVGRFALVALGGLPVLGLLVFAGLAEWPDLVPLVGLPFAWGTACGLAVTAWVYEPAAVRRFGELCGLFGVLLYLCLGVLAGEHLPTWLNNLPDPLNHWAYEFVKAFVFLNPFGVVRYWFDPDRFAPLAAERLLLMLAGAAILGTAAAIRAAARLKGHFHDRHYKPIDSGRADQVKLIGDAPLAWWAVRRVMEYSGRVNLWLAVGFAAVYAAFLVAGDAWPPWMGKLVFALFEQWGGAPVVATALVVLAAVPAAYQFGLWDPTVQARCARLELLLLTELTADDYWWASLKAAWARGRGYLIGSGMLWAALAAGGRIGAADAVAAALGGATCWAFAFAVGFRGFATGGQTNGTASLLTLGMPLVLFGLMKGGFPTAAAFVPAGGAYLPAAGLTGWEWAAGLLCAAYAAAFLTRRGRATCDADLRRWYDANQGTRAAG